MKPFSKNPEDILHCDVVQERYLAMSGNYATASPVVLCDIDGTLADPEHRLSWIADKKNANWFEFFSTVDHDMLITATLDKVWDYFYKGCRIWCVSGRPTFAEADGHLVPVADMTSVWLRKHRVPYERLFMRKALDYRSDEIVKPEIFTEQILPNLEGGIKQVVTALDDRPRVIKAWQAMGLHVTDVGNGIDF